MKSMLYNLELFKTPPAFQPGSLTLWSDSYVAENVIKIHLNGSIDSGSRKTVTLASSAKWISSLCSPNSSILDIGCGPGLYGNHLSKYVERYSGIDISPYQISYANAHNISPYNAFYHVCDFREWQPGQMNYDTVLLMYAIYSFYPLNVRLELLKKIKSVLNPGGRVVIEVFTAFHYDGRLDSTDWQYVEKNGFWRPTPYLELNSFSRYQNDLILIQTGVIDANTAIWNSWIELFSISKIEKELRKAGFSEFSYFGSCDGKILSERSEVLCVVAKI